MNGIMIILTLLSGVALFLFGMSLMGDGLKSVAGNKLELDVTVLKIVTGQETSYFVFIYFFYFHAITTCEFLVLL